MKRPHQDDHLNNGKSKLAKLSSENDGEVNRMKVCVRIRPFRDNEIENGHKSIIDVIDNTMLVFDPLVLDENDNNGHKVGRRANKNLQFFFDRVFSDTEKTIDVYTETTKNLVNSLMAGYNCSVFAYGSTGSGKTYTMLGSPEDPGIIFFTTMDIYKQLEDEKSQNLELSISYFEIYNELIYDLLDPTSSKPLLLLEDPNKGMTVKNLSCHQPKNAEHLLEMLEFGNKNRKQHPTDSNSESSRSHAIFQITLRRKDFSNEQDISIQVSKMSLVDLAGSERATTAYKTYRSQGLHREGGNINKSLLSLGNCINALTNNKNCYVPYRSSKLTLILRDSLGGNCQTLMIATVSSSSNQYEEIHNTLLYAERAKGVQLVSRKNNISIGVQPRDYKQMFQKMTEEKCRLMEKIENLTKENEKLKNRVETIPDNPVNSSTDAIEKLNLLKPILDELFDKSNALRRKYRDADHQIKLLNFRLWIRSSDSQRLKFMLNIDEDDKLTKTNDGLHSIYSQQLHYSNLKSSIYNDLEANENKILKLEKELLEKTNNDIVVQSYFIYNKSKTQLDDINQSSNHNIKMTKQILSKQKHDEDMMYDCVNFSNKVYHVMNGQGQISDELEAEYKNVVQKFKGKKSVIWRDDIDSPKLQKEKELLDLFSWTLDSNKLALTPDDNKRNLISIRNITPNVKSSASQNSNNNFGTATITKSKSVAVVSAIASQKSPLAPLPLASKGNRQAFYKRSNRFIYKSPFTNKNWRSPLKNENNFTPRSNNYTPNYQKNSYNPNFRPKFRF